MIEVYVNHHMLQACSLRMRQLANVIAFISYLRMPQLGFLQKHSLLRLYAISMWALKGLIHSTADMRHTALSVKYTDIARDNEDDKTPKLSVQRIFAGLYSSTEKVRSANEYCTTNDVRWAHVSSIMRCGGGPVD